MARLSHLLRRASRRGTGAAAVPVRRRKAGSLEFLLVRTSKGERWTFPKGGVERGESMAEAAAREAREEPTWLGFEAARSRLVQGHNLGYGEATERILRAAERAAGERGA